MDSLNVALEKVGLKRITLKNCLYFYMPVKGASNFVIFSANMLNPVILERWPLIPSSVSVPNLALLTSNVGLGLYMYGSRHMNGLPKMQRVTYSMFSTLMFTFGSTLILAIARTLLPENMVLRTAVGIGSGVSFLVLAKRYVDHLDSLPSSRS